MQFDLDRVGGDLVNMVNNTGTWIHPTLGECGDIGVARADRGLYDSPRPVGAICGVALAVAFDDMREGLRHLELGGPRWPQGERGGRP